MMMMMMVMTVTAIGNWIIRSSKLKRTEKVNW